MIASLRKHLQTFVRNNLFDYPGSGTLPLGKTKPCGRPTGHPGFNPVLYCTIDLGQVFITIYCNMFEDVSFRPSGEGI